MRNNFLNDKIRLQHILDAVSEIESYLEDKTENDFLDSSLVRNATLMQIQIIGEASSQITEEIKSNFPEVEWKNIKGTRNIIAHEYFGIDFKVVWEIAKFKLPILKEQVQQILESISKD